MPKALSASNPAAMFHGREAVQLENDRVRVTLLKGGGHIAEILHKATGVNPMWVPHWKSIEPATYDPSIHRDYGLNAESSLLAGIMGHNLCLDIFGPPSEDEAAAGVPVHGESSVATYATEVRDGRIHASARLPLANLEISRTVELDEDGRTVRISESVENLLAMDRPIGWTQHVTLGAPFLEHGVTEFGLSATRSRSFEAAGFDKSNLERGADFEWPFALRNEEPVLDLRRFPAESPTSRYTAHLMDPARDDAFFTAFSPTYKVLFGYEWKRADFPWLGIWEENRARLAPPWNGEAVACGMEFGVSPFPETRKQMVNRGQMFGVPGYRWLPARGRVTVEYSAFIQAADENPA